MYEFTEDCMIHIDNIDEEHRKLFQMLNEAFALVKETDNAASIAKNLIDNLKDYDRKPERLRSYAPCS